MARKNRFDQHIDSWSPLLKKAFSDSVYNLRSAAQIEQIARMLEAGDVEGAIRAVGLDPVAFRAFDKSLLNAFEAGGNFTSAALPIVQLSDGFKVKFQFNIRNPAAERWLSEHSSKLVTEILDDQRTMIRGFLQAGMAAGANPRTTALDLVGRVGASGRREGGALGLTTSQSEWVRNYSAELASDNPRAALARTLRDKRFDRAVISAAESGEPIPASLMSKMIDSYKNRALRFRAESVARTESMASLHEAQSQAMEQAVASGAIDQTNVTYIWHATMDNRTRDSHAEMDGQEVAMGEMFISGDGAQLEFPGDPNGPPEEVINCFHPSTRIHSAGLKGVISRHYSGELIELVVAGVVNLSVTPNHPILTERGWICARHLVEGDNLVNCEVVESVLPKPKINHGYASAESIADLAKLARRVYRAHTGTVNFHGEMPNHDVEIVSFPCELRNTFKASGLDAFGDIGLQETDQTQGALLADRLLHQFSVTPNGINSGIMGRLRQCTSFFLGHARKAKAVCFAAAAALQAKIINACGDDGAADLQLVGHSFHGYTFGMKARDFGMDLRSFSQVKVNDVPAFDQRDFLLAAPGQAEVAKTGRNHTVADSEFARDFCGGQSARVHPRDFWMKGNALFRPTKLVHVRHGYYEGPVFNFETDSGLILAEGIVTHNCRCWREPSVDLLSGIE